MMVSVVTIRWLRWHAGFESEISEEHDFSVAGCVGPTGLSGEHLEKAVADLLDAMALLNTELNGTTPSETLRQQGRFPERWSMR
jgi:hypothetical protein